MKTLFIFGILFTLTGATLGSTGVWMLQVGLIFLFGTLAGSKKQKITWSGLFLMITLFLWGFISGIWFLHPLGAIISTIAGGWVIYKIIRDRKHEVVNFATSLKKVFFSDLLPNIKQHIKWITVPLSILLILLLFKSILIAFIIGFGIVGFFDKESIQIKGVSRVAIILLLYTFGFFILLVGTFKIDTAYNSSTKLNFFTRDSYMLFRNIMRAL